jgi:hypothetical protein
VCVCVCVCVICSKAAFPAEQVTHLLHCRCYTVVTLLLHCYFAVLTLLLLCSYTVVTLCVRGVVRLAYSAQKQPSRQNRCSVCMCVYERKRETETVMVLQTDGYNVTGERLCVFVCVYVCVCVCVCVCV